LKSRTNFVTRKLVSCLIGNSQIIRAGFGGKENSVYYLSDEEENRES
jgi:hypothetical protein